MLADVYIPALPGKFHFSQTRSSKINKYIYIFRHRDLSLGISVSNTEFYLNAMNSGVLFKRCRPHTLLRTNIQNEKKRSYVKNFFISFPSGPLRHKRI